MKPNPETGKEEPLMKELSRPLVRRYIVFNASQIENVPPAHPFTIDEKDRNDAMEAMLKNSEASIHYDQANANYYNSRKDENPRHETGGLQEPRRLLRHLRP